MKILTIADAESKLLWDHFNPDSFADVELILAAGDLKSAYLSFLVTMLNVPLFYVHGNHDGSYDYDPPQGCLCIDDKVIEYKGLRIAGFGGCMAYTGGDFQYTEKQMAKRVKRMKRKLKKGIDILLTHSPAYRLGDGDDLPHTGFKVFVDLMNTYHPIYMIHGHQHLNYKRQSRIITYGHTTIVNAHEYELIEFIPEKNQ